MADEFVHDSAHRTATASSVVIRLSRRSPSLLPGLSRWASRVIYHSSSYQLFGPSLRLLYRRAAPALASVLHTISSEPVRGAAPPTRWWSNDERIREWVENRVVDR